MSNEISPIPETTSLKDGQYAGFPSPADDYLCRPLDLNDRLVPHPISTFFFEVKSDSATGERIFAGDTIVVDRAIDYRDGNLVLAVIDGQFAIRRLSLRGGHFWLCSSDQNQEDLPLTEECELWGRVMWSITRH
jgi:DNA polymerase V